MVELLLVIDPETNEVLQELSLDKEDWCWGSRAGATSEMCGGCDNCLAMQAYYYGCKLEVVTKHLYLPTKINWRKDGF